MRTCRSLATLLVNGGVVRERPLQSPSVRHPNHHVAHRVAAGKMLLDVLHNSCLRLVTSPQCGFFGVRCTGAIVAPEWCFRVHPPLALP